MADLQLQPSINDLRGQALLQLIQRLKALDLTPILVYIIQSLNDSAVLPMAWQWDVLNPLLAAGLTGAEQIQILSWDAISDIDTLTNIDLLSEIEQGGQSGSSFDAATYRALILLSTALHSTIGTPSALQNALSNLGFPNATILEGQNSWSGTQYPSNQGWAVFRVDIPLGTVQAEITASVVTTLVAACNFWKPARCWLDSVNFIASPIVDSLLPAPNDMLVGIFSQVDMLSPVPSDLIIASFFLLADIKTIAPFHNGRYYHRGITYGSTQPAMADSGVVVNGQAISANG